MGKVDLLFVQLTPEERINIMSLLASRPLNFDPPCDGKKGPKMHDREPRSEHLKRWSHAETEELVNLTKWYLCF